MQRVYINKGKFYLEGTREQISELADLCIKALESGNREAESDSPAVVGITRMTMPVVVRIVGGGGGL